MRRSANKFSHVGSKVDSGINPRRVHFADSPQSTPRNANKLSDKNAKENKNPVEQENPLLKKLEVATSEISVLQKMIEERDREIGHLNSLMNELNQHLKQLNSDIRMAEKQKSELHHKYSKKFRGSISEFQMQLDTTQNQNENKLEELRENFETVLSNLKAKISTNEGVIAAKSSEILRLQNSLDESQSNRERLLATMKQMSDERSSQIQELEKDVTEVVHKYKALKSEKMDLEEALACARDEAKKLKMSKLEMKKQLQESHRDTDATAKLEKENFYLRQEVNQLENTIEMLKHKKEFSFMEGGDAPGKTHDQLKIMEHQIIDLSEKNSTLGDENKDLMNQVTRKDVRITLLEEKISQLESSLTRERKQFADTSNSYHQKIENLENILCQKQAEIEEKSHGIELHKLQSQELEVAKQELSQKEMELIERADQISKLERKVVQHENSKELLKRACSILEGQMIEFENVLQEKTSELQKHEKLKTESVVEIACLKREIEKLNMDLVKQLEQKKELESKYKEIESELKVEDAHWVHRAQAYEDKMSGLRQENSRLEEDLDRMSKSLRDAERTKSTLTQRNENIRKVNTNLQIESSERLTQIMDLRAKTTLLTIQRDRLEKDCAALREEVEALEDKNKSCERDAVVKDRLRQAKIDEYVEQLAQLQKDYDEMKIKPKKTIAERLFGKEQMKGSR